MKQDILEIARELETRQITTEEAKKQLLVLFDVVGRSEQLPQIHGLIKCECGKVYDVDLEKNCPQCGN